MAALAHTKIARGCDTCDPTAFPIPDFKDAINFEAIHHAMY